MPLPKDITTYNAAQSPAHKKICSTLAKHIDAHLAGLEGAERKLWHRHPVWFLHGNPIVGYSKVADSIRLMFWSGESFNEPNLPKDPADSKFKSAGACYTTATEINPKDLTSWLDKSITIQWDYKNIVKRKGKLLRLK
jgi:hypothetical protein